MQRPVIRNDKLNIKIEVSSKVPQLIICHALISLKNLRDFHSIKFHTETENRIFTLFFLYFPVDWKLRIFIIQPGLNPARNFPRICGVKAFPFKFPFSQYFNLTAKIILFVYLKC